jgi:hypothetical protein
MRPTVLEICAGIRAPKNRLVNGSLDQVAAIEQVLTPGSVELR